jgi:hypothetical protein
MPNLDNVYVVSGNGEPLGSLVLNGATIAEAAKDPAAIGRLMVDMAYAEGAGDLSDYMLTYERNNNPIRVLEGFETGMEDFLTGGWVRVLTPPKLADMERPIINKMISDGTAVDHGLYRGVRLIEFFPNA